MEFPGYGGHLPNLFILYGAVEMEKIKSVRDIELQIDIIDELIRDGAFDQESLETCRNELKNGIGITRLCDNIEAGLHLVAPLIDRLENHYDCDDGLYLDRATLGKALASLELLRVEMVEE
jgi:hypothetical protein